MDFYLWPIYFFMQLKKERDELYKPKILIDVNLEQSLQRERELERERERELERQKARERERLQKERYVVAQASRELAAVDAEPIESDSSNDGHFASPDPPPMEDMNSDSRDSADRLPDTAEEESSQHSSTQMSSPTLKITTITTNNKKKKLEVSDVFNNAEDDEDSNGMMKKRKLIPLDYDDNKSKPSDLASAHAKDKSKNLEESAKSQEEKRRHIKSLIDKIPTEKNALFNFQLDWAVIDNGLMEKKIRPWINKKIIEYIGEPEPTLVDFICSKVLAGSSPQGIIDDVQMVIILLTFSLIL